MRDIENPRGNGGGARTFTRSGNGYPQDIIPTDVKQLANRAPYWVESITGTARVYRDLATILSETTPPQVDRALNYLLSEDAHPSVLLLLYARWVTTPWPADAPRLRELEQLLEYMGWIDGNWIRGANSRQVKGGANGRA
jgi:hypothetical protein